MKSHDRYAEIQAFVSIARLASFGAAASQLGLTASATSRKLQALEARLGVRLLQRTTRRVTLTEAGQQYLLHCERWLSDLDDADAALADLQGQVRGRLRASVPSNFGRLHVVPALPDFLAAYPELDLDLDFNDRYLDLVEAQIDVAIRIGRLDDSRLVARKLADNRRLLAASPDYLARRGTPQHPGELAQHSCLHFSRYSEGELWRLHKGGETQEIQVRGRMRANNGEALVEAALAGYGILQSASFIVGPALQQGWLVEVLPDWHIAPSAIWAVYPHGRFLAPKVRAFIDFFGQRYSAASWLQQSEV